MKTRIMRFNNRRVRVLVPERVISTKEFLERIGPKLDKIIRRLQAG